MAKGTYIGVSSVARTVVQPYIGVNGVARSVIKKYIGVNGVARLCFEAGVKWNKYSCNYTPEKYYIDASRTRTIEYYYPTDKSYLNYTIYYYPSISFSENDGFIIPDSSSSFVLTQDTFNDVDSIYGTYSADTNHINTTKRSSITKVWYMTANNKIRVYMTISVEYLSKYPATYEKGSVSYNAVRAPEGELPDEGTLIEGSVEEGYCVLQVDSTYYYYELEV